MAETAELVARVRVEDREFRRGMEASERGLRDTTKEVKRGEGEKQRELDLTAAGLGRVRLGWLSLGTAAAGGLAGFIAQSTIVNAQLGTTRTLLGAIADQAVVGFGLDKEFAEINASLADFVKFLAEAREAGGGNLAVGLPIQVAREAGSGFSTGFESAAEASREDSFLRRAVNSAQDLAAIRGGSLQEVMEVPEELGRAAGRFAPEFSALGGILTAAGVGPPPPPPAVSSVRSEFPQLPPSSAFTGHPLPPAASSVRSGEQVIPLPPGLTVSEPPPPREDVVRVVVEAPSDPQFQLILNRWFEEKVRAGFGGGG